MKPARFSKPSKKIAIALSLTAALAVGSVAALSPVFGQAETQAETASQVTLTAIPPRMGEDMSIVIEPGGKEQIQIRVRNSSDTSLDIISRVSDFIIGEDGATPVPVEEDVTSRWSLASWLTLVPSRQTLSPNEIGAVNVLIEVPKDALPGGHYAMVTHERASGADEAGASEADLNSASSISQRVATLIYVRVAGDINEEAFVRDFSFPDLTEFGPVPFSYSVENASDIHITPRTSIKIYNMFGKHVDTIEVEPKNVFPMMSRDFDDQWDEVWGSGLYTAKLTMSFGETGKIAVAQTKFWLLPVKLILAGLILILTIIAMGISIRRHYIHRKGDDQQRINMLEGRLRELEGNKLDKYED